MTATGSYLLLRALCDELARCGMQHACTSPGSRCTPIVLSLVREPRIHCWSHIDERCAGFFALGAARASGRPVAVTCTSGTAAANLAPAVIEAFHAGVPMIVLTSDRPPELRDVGAGQTIDQLKLYGDAVKWFVEVGVHDADPQRLRWIRALACRAYWTALDGRPGPVQLNVPLREPLVLEGPLPDDPLPGRTDGGPWLRRAPAPAPSADAHGLRALPARGVVVAGASGIGGIDCVDSSGGFGRAESPGLGGEVARFAERVGYPLLADPLSGARHGETAIARYDVLLRAPRFADHVQPELVIRVGDLPTSKSLRSWLASLSTTEQLALDPRAARHDPASVLTELERGDPVAALRASERHGPADPAWLQRWRLADDAAGEAIAAALGDDLSEPLVAASLGAWLAPEATLFVASSMPIRDVELFFAAGVAGPRVISNRGANGIDGTVSSAFGTAAVSDGGPVVLLIGDVALLHDIGGLLAARRLGLGLTIVLINNDGGGIFHFLAVSGETDAFEQHVATPHGIDFAHAAQLYGCGYRAVATVAELRAAVEASIAQPAATTVIEVRTDRDQNLALHQRVAAAALAALTLSQPTPAASPGA